MVIRLIDETIPAHRPQRLAAPSAENAIAAADRAIAAAAPADLGKLIAERAELLLSDGKAGDYRTALRMAQAEFGQLGAALR